MANWQAGRLLAFDLETTGLDPEEARIVIAAVLFLDGGSVSERLDWLLDPGVAIPPDAAAIHGITTAIARAKGAAPGPAVSEIVAALWRAMASEIPLVAFNAPYDFTVLDRECRRRGVTPLEPALVIDRAMDRYRKGPRTLLNVAAHYQVPFNAAEAHAADADALAAAGLAVCLASTYPAVGAMTLADLHQAQIGWQAEHTRSLVAYYRRRGDVRAISDEWPVIRFGGPA